jgi:hypothetical protein
MNAPRKLLKLVLLLADNQIAELQRQAELARFTPKADEYRDKINELMARKADAIEEMEGR